MKAKRRWRRFRRSPEKASFRGSFFILFYFLLRCLFTTKHGAIFLSLNIQNCTQKVVVWTRIKGLWRTTIFDVSPLAD